MEQRLDAELRDHFERLLAANLARGMPPEQARRVARLEFGGAEQVKEECRDARGTLWVEATWQDIRFAVRTLRKSPGLLAAAAGTLALGIGANTAIFSVVYSVLIKPLPYASPGELVAMTTYIPQVRDRFPSLPVRATDFLEFRRSNTVFSGMAAVEAADFNLTGDGEPERLYGARVSANLFSLLGVQPELGRTFLPDEDTLGRDRVVLISHALWMRRWGGDPGILNRTISLYGRPFQIVGIMPPGFLFPTGKQLHSLVPFGPRVDIWKPMGFTQSDITSEGSWNYGVIARLKPGASPAAAEQQLNAIAQTIVARVRKQVPRLGFDLRAQLAPLRTVFTGDVRQGLLVLLAAVGLLLAIGCINLANLLLARMSSRERELATRVALGAPRLRLVRQLLTESLVIALCGAAASLAVANWGTRLLVSLAPANLPALALLRFNLPVLLFTVVLALFAGLAFGMAPACRTRNIRAAMRGTHGAGTRRILVAAEVALAMALLAVAGLLLHSFVRVMNIDKGFAVERIVSAELALPAQRYNDSRALAFYSQFLESLRALPGVAGADAVSGLPLLNETNTTPLYLENDRDYRLDRPVAIARSVTPDYFRTMGITLLAGRFLEEQESSQVIVLGASLARKLWPGEPPANVIGRHVRTGDFQSDLLTVIGVTGDVRTGALEREPMPLFYRPYGQWQQSQMTVVVRTFEDPQTLAPVVRAAIWRLDRDLPIASMKTMREVVSASVAPRRFQMALVVLFAALSLALALVGIYGVTSYSVARQTREIGMRMALGAQKSDVIRAVLAQGLQPVVAGLALGLAGARLAAILVRSLLFGVSPLDPVAIGGVALLLLAAAALACYIPARRAARLDPVIALRCD